MKSPAQYFSSFKSMMFEKYGENPGTMLVHTGVLGWILSSLAQVTAVIINDKISPEQKSFLIPQEIADAGVNIISFYLITSSFKSLASKLVSSGKLSTPKIRKFLSKQGISTNEYIGKLNFNIERLANFQDIKEDYKPFKNGVDVIASTVGSIISCNIVTPILRNKIAAERQKSELNKMYVNHTQVLKHPKGISMADYQKAAMIKHSSLKI